MGRPIARCLICLLYKVIITMKRAKGEISVKNVKLYKVITMIKRAKREIRVRNVKTQWHFFLKTAIFSFGCELFLLPWLLHELVSGTVSTRSSSSFHRNSFTDFAWTAARLALCCISHKTAQHVLPRFTRLFVCTTVENN